jgi:predicted HNH restriction endonuclease
MDVIESLKPTVRLRLIDLLSTAGVDVSDWSNVKGGKAKASTNPKYCYEWSYEDSTQQLIVLNLWFDNLEIEDGSVVQKINMRKVAQDRTNSSPQSKRALTTDVALQLAHKQNWTVKVMICDGPPRALGETRSKASRRKLDTETWYIKRYDMNTGDCVLVRGIASLKFIDQFEINKDDEPTRREVITSAFERSAVVRQFALNRANGHCELCGVEGFKTASGLIYLESHHIIPLSEGGLDNAKNVIALCPNHHRQAHYGENRELIQQHLLNYIYNLSAILSQ